MGVNITKQGIWTADGNETKENLLKLIPKSYSSSAYGAYQFNMIKNLEANKTYTIQFWNVDVAHSAKSVADLGIDVYWGGGNLRMKYWHGTSYFTNGHADYLVGTFTVTSTQATGTGSANLWLNIYNSVGNANGTRSMHIDRWKLEEGSKPTPWLPATSDSIYISSTTPFVETDKDNKLYIGQDYIDANQFYEI